MNRKLMKTLSIAKGFHTFLNALDDKGVSPSAEGNQRRCLWTPRAFCKKLDQKLYSLLLILPAGTEVAQAVNAPENGDQNKGSQANRVKNLDHTADSKRTQKTYFKFL